MSKPGLYYHLEVQNAETTTDHDVRNPQILWVDIYDTDFQIDDALPVFVVPLDGAEIPIEFSTIDNDEDRFKVIKSTQLTIRVLSNISITLNDFASGSAQRWYVEVARGAGKIIFKGFLSIADMSEDFMPHPHIIELTATDGLGLLKDIPLTKPDGTNPKGYFKVGEYITWALLKTGLSINMDVVFNIREEANSSAHFFNSIYLQAKTFEDEVGVSINCYDVIEWILGNEACLFQRNGFWMILRIDEMETGTVESYRFDITPAIISQTTENFTKEIGKDGYVIFFANEATRVYIDMRYKEVKLIFDYLVPLEVPCNLEFERATFYSDLPDETDADAVTYKVKKYLPIECWESLYEAVSTDEPLPDNTIYVKRRFYNGYERERRLVIEFNSTYYSFVMSEAIPVSVKDKFVLSLDRRLNADLTDSGYFADGEVQTRLYGDDGTFWTHHGGITSNPTPKWVQCTSTFRTNQQYFWYEGNKDDDNTLVMSLTGGESAEIPVSGDIKIVIHQRGFFTADKRDSYYSNLGFEYIPFINGSYQKYTGQSHTVIQEVKNKIKRDEKVYISDSPKRLFKGGLFIYTGVAHKLAGRFYSAAVFPTLPDEIYRHPYGEIQVFDVWNQYRVEMRIFQADCKGLASGDTDAVKGEANMISLYHRLLLQDATGHTTNRRFLLLSYNMRWDLCEFTGVIREVYNTNSPKDYSGHNFKYLSNE